MGWGGGGGGACLGLPALCFQGIINTQPTSDDVLGLVSTLAASPISTFVRHYVPCTQVDIGLAARVDTRPHTPSSVGFVYLLPTRSEERGVLGFGSRPITVAILPSCQDV